MDKFPRDVEEAERRTNGDPDIIEQEKFSPEKKPDISALFGEKKLPKKKQRVGGVGDEQHNRRSSTTSKDTPRSTTIITHPRFVGSHESDHEVRIRMQPSSNSSPSGRYPCPLCHFTTARVNVIIQHIKGHKHQDTYVRPKVKHSTPRVKSSSDSAATPKRKYVKKDKSGGGGGGSAAKPKQRESNNKLQESTGKRKIAALNKSSSGDDKSHQQQQQQQHKKKRTEDEEYLKEKLLADWDDESDDELDLDVTQSSLNATQQHTSMDVVDEVTSPPLKLMNSSSGESHKDAAAEEEEEEDETNDDGQRANNNSSSSDSLLEETERLLRDTDDLSKIKDMEPKSSSSSKIIESSTSDNKSKIFDFDEDDVPEPTIPHVRKIPRVFGEKTSMKKEMIKEFEKSQALKNNTTTGTGKETASPEKKNFLSKPGLVEPGDKNYSNDEDVDEEAKEEQQQQLVVVVKNSSSSSSPVRETTVEIVEEYLEMREDLPKEEKCDGSTESKVPLDETKKATDEEKLPLDEDLTEKDLSDNLSSINDSAKDDSLDESSCQQTVAGDATQKVCTIC